MENERGTVIDFINSDIEYRIEWLSAQNNLSDEEQDELKELQRTQSGLQALDTQIMQLNKEKALQSEINRLELDRIELAEPLEKFYKKGLPLFIVRQVDFSDVNSLLSENVYKHFLHQNHGHCVDGNISAFQLYVADQMSNRGGGGASCGYHALKNGFIIALAAFVPEEAQAKILSLVKDSGLIRVLFGEDTSIWREHIYALKKAQKLKEYVIEYFKLVLKDGYIKSQSGERAQEENILSREFNDISRNVSSILKEPTHQDYLIARYLNIISNAGVSLAKSFNSKFSFNQYNPCIIDGAILVKHLKDAIDRSELSDQEKQILSSDETIKDFFPDIYNNKLIVRKYDLVEQDCIANDEHSPKQWNSIRTDWIRDNDIENLCNMIKDQFPEGKFKFIVIESNLDRVLSDSLNPHLEQTSFQNNSKEVRVQDQDLETHGKTPIRDILQLKCVTDLLENYYGILLIVLIRGERKPTDGNHWVTIIVNRTEEGAQYIFADSMDNIRHIRDYAQSKN